MKSLVLALTLLGLVVTRAATLEETMRQLVGPKHQPIENLSPLIIGTPGLRENRKLEEVIYTYVQPAMFRSLNGVNYDLRPLAAQNQAGKFTGVFPVALEGWEVVSGRVIDTAPEGVLLQTTNQVIFIAGKLPGKPIDEKNNYRNLFVKLNGTFQVYAAGGGARNIPRYEQGQIDEASYQAAIDKLVKGITAIKEAEDKQIAAKLSAVDEKALAFQLKQAEAGSGQAQYALAIRYLEGKGVERDEAKGMEWLNKSAEKDFGPAKRKLEELEKAKTKKD